MKRSRILLIVAALAALVVAGLGCKAAPTLDFTVTSSIVNGHSHKIVILGANVDQPPAEKIIKSDGADHTHNVTLSKQDYEAIKKGKQITVTSSSTGIPPHSHTFIIKKGSATKTTGSSGY